MYLSSLEEVALAAFVHLHKLLIDSLMSSNNINISHQQHHHQQQHHQQQQQNQKIVI